MSRPEQLYAGTLAIDDTEAYGEVWVAGAGAAIFVDNKVVSKLSNIDVGNDEQGRLVIFGTDDADKMVVVEALQPEQTMGTWQKAKVVHPEHPEWADGVTLMWSQYRVTVKHPSADPVVLPGASVRTLGAREAYVSIPGQVTAVAELPVSLPRRTGCCGG